MSMIVEQKGMTRSKAPRVVLTCSPEEAAIIRTALLAYSEANKSEPHMGSVAEWTKNLGARIPEPR